MELHGQETWFWPIEFSTSVVKKGDKGTRLEAEDEGTFVLLVESPSAAVCQRAFTCKSSIAGLVTMHRTIRMQRRAIRGLGSD